MKHKTSIFFITGTSGSGKSTLMHYLKMSLSNNYYMVYDFDEYGVPPNADAQWRQEATKYWLIKASENSKLHKSTIICGVSVPSEVLNSTVKIDIPIYFGLLKVSDDIIQQRLQERGWTDALIKDNINWAHYLECAVKQTNEYLIVDSSCGMLPEHIADVFIKWIIFHEKS